MKWDAKWHIVFRENGEKKISIFWNFLLKNNFSPAEVFAVSLLPKSHVLKNKNQQM